MNKCKLIDTFTKIKNATKMDYAVVNTDDYGDCNTCVNYGLSDEFGIDSTGIYIKHWSHGMNRGKSWKELKGVFIAHDIKKEQADIMIKTLKENGYEIEPKEYDVSKAFLIKEKEEE